MHFDFEINMIFKQKSKNRQSICSIFWIKNLSFFQNRNYSIKSVLIMSTKFRAFSKNDVLLWHFRMKHFASTNFEKLKTNNLKMKLIDSSMIECETCAKTKISKQISRQSFDRSMIKKFQKLHINWIDFSKIISKFIRILFIINCFIDIIMSYFMITIFEKTKNLRILKNIAT